jgi:hypothetical protein
MEWLVDHKIPIGIWAKDGVDWLTGPGLLGLETGELEEPIRTELPRNDGQVTYYFTAAATLGGLDVGESARHPPVGVVHRLVDDGAVLRHQPVLGAPDIQRGWLERDIGNGGGGDHFLERGFHNRRSSP